MCHDAILYFVGGVCGEIKSVCYKACRYGSALREIYVLWIVSRDFKVSSLCCGANVFSGMCTVDSVCVCVCV